MRVPRAAGAGKGPGMEMVFAVQLALFGPSANFLPEFYALCSPAYFYCTPRLGVAAALPPRAPQNYPPPNSRIPSFKRIGLPAALGTRNRRRSWSATPRSSGQGT